MEDPDKKKFSRNTNFNRNSLFSKNKNFCEAGGGGGGGGMKPGKKPKFTHICVLFDYWFLQPWYHGIYQCTAEPYVWEFAILYTLNFKLMSSNIKTSTHFNSYTSLCSRVEKNRPVHSFEQTANQIKQCLRPLSCTGSVAPTWRLCL